MVISNITLSICTFINIFILTIVYFSKQRVDYVENKVYSGMIVTSFIGNILNLLCYIILNNEFGLQRIMYLIILKGILCYFLTWIVLFTLYYYLISSNKNSIKIFLSSCKKIIISIYIMLLLIVLMLPLNYLKVDGMEIPVGLSINFLYILSAICVLIMLIILILNIKRTFNKKYIPLFLFIIVGIIFIFYQKDNPQILLLIPIEVLFAF